MPAGGFYFVIITKLFDTSKPYMRIFQMSMVKMRIDKAVSQFIHKRVIHAKHKSAVVLYALGKPFNVCQLPLK